MIRSFIFWFNMILCCLFFSTLILVLSPLLAWSLRGQAFLHQLACIWGKTIIKGTPGWSAEIQDLSNQAFKMKPVIFVSNHSSQVDILVACALPANFRWLAKHTLFRIPLVGWAMHAIGYVPVVRKDPISRSRCLEDAKRHLSRGVSMLFFPEGTRTAGGSGHLGRFKLGAFKLASELQIPIVPLSIHGAGALSPPGQFKIGSGQVKLIVHDSIPSEGKTADELSRLAHNVIHKALLTTELREV